MMPPLHPAIAIVSLGLEAGFGYPQALFRRVGHPVTWIGALLEVLERRLNRHTDSFGRRRGAGALAILLLMFASCLCGFAMQTVALATLPRLVAILLIGVLASSCLAQRSLDDHVRAVRDALRSGGLPAGRAAVALIVGRDTETLDEAGIASAAVESLAENFSDGIVAPALYLALGGLAGGLIYKAVNTADSMIGHRTPRYEAFGFAAAKLDDVANWPSARLAGLLIVLAASIVPGASAASAWRIMARDARGHSSPNAGWPEAAMAGALGIKLGGPRAYAGRMIEDAGMGDGDTADVSAITRALKLYRVACGLNALAILALAVAIAPWR